MEVVHERCAALDVSKRDAKVCVRAPGKRRGTFTHEVTTWGATTNQVLALREFLLDAGVTAVVIEATGDYWKPFVRHEALVNRAGVKGLCLRSVAAGR